MQFSSVSGGVRVSTDAGIILGVAQTFGQRLSGDDVLSQLGYKSDGNGGAVRLSTSEQTARLVNAEAPIVEAEPEATVGPYDGLSRADLRAIAKGRGVKYTARDSGAKLRELLAE